MDSELFTIGGVGTSIHDPWAGADQKASAENVNYQWARTLQTYRHVGKIIYWLLVICTIYLITTIIPLVGKLWNEYKNSFTQKEGLQYLGASTNVTRDDTGWPAHDSLAEMAMKAQNAATDMASAPATKATFIVPREGMAGAHKKELTPEEKLMMQQKAAAMSH